MFDHHGRVPLTDEQLTVLARIERVKHRPSEYALGALAAMNLCIPTPDEALRTSRAAAAGTRSVAKCSHPRRPRPGSPRSRRTTTRRPSRSPAPAPRVNPGDVERICEAKAARAGRRGREI